MANREKGEIDLTIAGTTYTFKLGTAALIALQESVSAPPQIESVESIWAQIARGRIKYVRALLWAGLQKFHRGITLDQVDDLLDDATQDEVQRLLSDLGLTTQPAPEDMKELSEGVTKRPRKARAIRGTGGNSTSTRARSV